jgi:hypothetical protein
MVTRTIEQQAFVAILLVIIANAVPKAKAAEGVHTKRRGGSGAVAGRVVGPLRGALLVPVRSRNFVSIRGHSVASMLASGYRWLAGMLRDLCIRAREDDTSETKNTHTKRQQQPIDSK